MKKRLFTLIPLIAFTFFTLSACGEYDYMQNVSDIRSDIFLAQTEEFSVTLSCSTREYPYLSDGIANERTMLVEIVLIAEQSAEYEVYVLDDVVWGGDMSFRNVTGDYYYSKSVTAFPDESVSLRVQWNGETREFAATTVKNENTLTTDEILENTLEYEKDAVKQLTVNGCFYGEFYIRLLRRDKNYYYVAIIDTNGKTISLLLDSETGELLARRVRG